MADEVTPERVQAVSAAARVPLDAASAARVARATNPTISRLTAEKLALPLEVEPSTYVVVARREIGR